MKKNKHKAKIEEDVVYDGPPPSDEFDSNLKPKPKSSGTIVSPLKRVKKEKGIPSTTNDASAPPSLTFKAVALSYASADTTYTTCRCCNTQDNDDCSKAVEQKKDEISFAVSKIIYKTDNLSKERDLTLKLNELLGYTKVVDNPKNQQFALELFASDYTELELTEIGDDDIKPRYEVFGDNQPLCKNHADICSEWKINNNCPDCYSDCCDEWRFGDYCVMVVRRYWEENSHSASVREAYIHFVSHYNRVLDWHSFGEGLTHKLRKTQVTKPPYYMKKGSLRFSIQWIKWQLENGSEREWYTELRKRKRLERKEMAAKEEERKKEFKT